MKAKDCFATGVVVFLFTAAIGFQTAASAQSNNCVAAPAGLVGWWKGDGNGNDSAGTNNATVPDGVTFAPAEVGQGFNLDGQAHQIVVPDAPALNFSSNQDFSLEVWIQPLANPGNWKDVMSIIDKRVAPDTITQLGYELNLEGGVVTFQMADTLAPFSWHNFAVGPDLRDGQFHHVAVTVQRNSTSGGQIYIDGQLLLTFDPTVCPGDLSNPGPLRIGNHATPGLLAFYHGIIDEVSLYNRSLSSTEIVSIYQAGSAGKCSAQLTPCVPAPSGLVSWWRGEGNANDEVGGNHGILVNGVSFSPGKVGQGFHFDGNNSYIRVPHSASLNLANALTLELWYEDQRPAFLGFGLIAKRGTGIDPCNFGINLLDSGLGVYYNDPAYFNNPSSDDSLTYETSRYPTLPAANVFHHLAATYQQFDASHIQLKTYVDGQLVRDKLVVGNLANTLSTNDVTIGASSPTGEFMNGIMDEVSLYNRALSASEILSIYNAGSAGKCPPPTTNCVPAPSGLVGWWKGDGNTLDSVAGNNGVAVNVGFTNGVVGQAFSCDAENFPYGTYVGVDIPDRPDYALTNSLTMEGWIRPRGDGYMIFYRGDNRPGLDPYQLSMQHNNVLLFGIADQAGNFATVQITLAYNQWYHVAGTLDGSSGTMSLYTNGTLAAQITTTVRPFGELIPTDSPGIGIGNVNDGFNNFPFIGDIDEIALYNRALSPGEVQSIYNAGSAGKCPSLSPPGINAQPMDQTVAAGGTATFSVVAQGAPPLSYQWFFGTNLLAGQTGASLVLDNVQPSQAGYYSIVVSNAFGALTSSNALLTVMTLPPAITLQPRDVTTYSGSNVTFSVQAVGTAPLSYQWYFNGIPVGTAASSQTDRSPRLFLRNVQPNQAGNYWVAVSSAYGFTVSSNAVLTVLPPPVCVPPPSGIVAWWRGESNLIDSVGINDLSPSTLQSVPPYYLFTPGKVGTALLFPYVGPLQTHASDDLDVGLGAGLTIEGWIKPDSTMPPQPLVEWNDGRGILGAGLFLNPGFGPGVIGAYFTETNFPITGGGPHMVLFRSPALVITNQTWQHVALTFDRLTGLAAIFVNGVSVAQTNLGVFTPMTKAPVYVGYNPTGPFSGSRFSGAMDEISLYNRALSPAEIQSIYRADYVGKCAPPPPSCVPTPPGIVAWWRGQSNTLDSVDGNDATMMPPNLPPYLEYSAGYAAAGFSLREGNYLLVPASDSLNVGAGTGLTVEAWINPTQFFPYPIAEWNSGTGTQGVYLAYSFTRGPSYLEASLVDTLGMSHVFLSPVGAATAGAWQHVALTYDKASGLAALFVNGNAVTQTNLGSFTPRTTGNLYLGYRPPGPYTGSGYRFNGSMDEVGVYGRALTALEIRSIVAARGSGKCTEPPAIVTQPQSQIVNLGSTAVLSVTADGTPLLRYQWFYGSNAVAGATDSILTLTNVQAGQAGTYLVVVSNKFGVVTSSNAVLKLNTPPVADASATATRVIACDGATNGTVILNGSRSSDADGDPLQYLWFNSGTTGTLATGVVAVAALPLGTNWIKVQVSDGLATNDQTIAVEVITTGQAVEELIAQVTSLRKADPLRDTLAAARKAIRRGQCAAAIAELRAFQFAVRARIGRHDPALAETLNRAAREIIEALEHCCHCHDGDRHERGTPRIRHDGRRVHLEFPGTHGSPYIIEASSDMVHWEKIGVATDRNDGNFEFDEAPPGQQPMRFYRVVAP